MMACHTWCTVYAHGVRGEMYHIPQAAVAVRPRGRMGGLGHGRPLHGRTETPEQRRMLGCGTTTMLRTAAVAAMVAGGRHSACHVAGWMRHTSPAGRLTYVAPLDTVQTPAESSTACRVERN